MLSQRMPSPIHLLLVAATLVVTATADIVHVSVLFRHGHRSPVQLLPSQNFTVANTWRDGLGQLTNIGKQNELELGKFLRKRYGAFLDNRYNSSEHYARSTDVDRTLMSAQACLAGLFPPVGDQQWSPDLPSWQPIPVHTRPQSSDLLLGSPEFPCPERDHQFASMRSDPVRLAFYAPYADFLRRLTAGSGMSVTADSVHSVMDTLWINRVAGLPDPSWLNSTGDWQQLVTVASYQWREYSWTPDLTRFGSGFLLDRILDNAAKIAAGQLPAWGQKLRLYSDHDTTVASTLAALGNRDFVWPNFAACLLFELHSPASAGGQHLLRVWLRNDTARDPLLIGLAGCTDPCPLDQALQILGPARLTREQLLANCQGDFGGNGGNGMFGYRWLNRVSLAAVAGCFLLTCLCLTVLVVCRCVRSRRGRPAVVYRSLADDVEG